MGKEFYWIIIFCYNTFMKKIFKFSSILLVVIGVGLIGGGVWGIYFTYKSIVQENIVTPEDATISEKPVRGPFTLMAQANIIRKHTLALTGGKTFAEMPRQIAKLDEHDQQVLDDQGKPVMVANTVRDTWITATTLITALNLGILTYAFSALVILCGLIVIIVGVISNILSRQIANN